MLNPVHFLFSQQEIPVSPILLCHRFIPINLFIFYFLSHLFFLLQRQITCDLLGEKNNPLITCYERSFAHFFMTVACMPKMSCVA